MPSCHVGIHNPSRDRWFELQATLWFIAIIILISMRSQTLRTDFEMFKTHPGYQQSTFKPGGYEYPIGDEEAGNSEVLTKTEQAGTPPPLPPLPVRQPSAAAVNDSSKIMQSGWREIRTRSPKLQAPEKRGRRP